MWRWVVAALTIATLMQLPARADPAAETARRAYQASMEGRKADALAAAQDLAGQALLEQVLARGGSGWELTPQYAVLVRFGLWDELIALGPPDPRAPGLTAGYLYGRGVALAARGRLADARVALTALGRLGAEARPGAGVAGRELHDLIAVAVPVVAARIAATELRNQDAIRELEEAVAAEDRLPDGERADWFFPVRHLLGAQLLFAGNAAEARRVYREDLERHPANGWALRGLTAALRAAGRNGAAAARERQFERAWKQADVRLTASAFWFPGADTTSCDCQRPAAD